MPIAGKKEVVENDGVHPPEVLEWRKLRSESMGYDDLTSTLIAHTRISLSELEKLISKGCPHDLALKILFGTNEIGEEDPIWINKAY